jgi:hypothetical protein
MSNQSYVNSRRLMAAAHDCRTTKSDGEVTKILRAHGLNTVIDCQADDEKTETVVQALLGTEQAAFAAGVAGQSYEEAHGAIHQRAFAKFNNKPAATDEAKPSAAGQSFDELYSNAFAKWNSAGTALK